MGLLVIWAPNNFVDFTINRWNFQPIYNETVDYKEIGDDTPPYMTQIAKDIVTFLRYSTDITKDMRQLEFLRAIGVIIPAFFIAVFWNKRNWGPTKTQKMIRSEDLRKFK